MAKTRIFLVAAGLPNQFDQCNPPMGLLYIAAWLRRQFDVEIQIAEQRVESLDCATLVKRIASFDADIVGLGCMTPYAHALPAIVQGLRAALPKAVIVQGGPHVLAYGVGALEDSGADLAVAGEGERSMEMILSAWLDGGDMSAIPGLIRRDRDGQIVANPGATPIVEDMDTLPFPAYDLIDLRRHWRINSHNLLPYPHKYAMMFASRGCPYGCTYCSNVFGRKYRSYSAERLVAEIAFYKSQYDIDEVAFFDDCFNMDPRHTKSFADLLLNKIGPLKMTFCNGLRADILDESIVDALVAAGMYCCHFALETGSPRLQKFVRKNLDIDKFLQVVEWNTNRGVFTNGFVMLGFPTETEAELKQTIRTAAESRLHTAEFFTVTPWPNTELSQYVRTHAPEKLEGLRFMDEEYWRIRVNLSDVPDETLFYYQRKAYQTFYFRPGRLFRIARDYPRPLYLPTRLPHIIQRMTKGLFDFGA